ncbi:MAG: glycosyltransferase family 4 protein, partial [Microvirgula sp.]
MTLFVCTLLASFILTMWLVRSSHIHARLSADSDLSGIQKFHVTPVPRIGGIALAAAMLAGWLILWLRQSPLHTAYLSLLAVMLPSFFSGLHEDLSKHGGLGLRMTGILLSAGLGWWLLDVRIIRLDIPMLEVALHNPIISLLLTLVAVCGVTNAMNFIDGYNGLASAVAAIMLGGIAYVALLLGDHLIWSCAIAGVGASLGFLLWNWPRGLIFLGDGGAYLLGFLIAALDILLVARNPQVSPWFALLLVSYPVVEMSFTVLRRTSRRSNPGMPDAAHLHQLIYKRLMKWTVGSSRPSDKLFRNSMTSPYLWLLSSLGVIPAVLFWDNTSLLQL